MPVSSRPRHPRRRSDGDSGRSMPAVAHLLAADDRIVGGVAKRDDEYALVLGGRVIASTDSAGMAIAMLRHARATLSNDDTPLSIRVAPALETPATLEAEAAGLTLEAYLAVLEAERVERSDDRDAASRPQ
ncbi:hypothetical protein [Cognatilysobacter terrigena]|uniref:hypothetical protein n=1 Tax=Cognatilysobacter terrigena TaxID=2488749 RepID=UPI00105C3ED1|nr:hypothetical protein [Lysobacter terrigena]